MRKNKMMRLASVLLVLTLLTTCMISGTFAKYVTTNSGADYARVAQFGVVISVEDDMGMFTTEYDTGAANITVESNTSVGDNSDNRVAPGTSGSMTFSITGTPEVTTQLDVVVNGSAIQLKAGSYTLDAGKFAEEAVTVTTTSVYEPIKFCFGEGTEVPANADYAYTLNGLETELEKLTGENEPNTNLAKNYYIGWKWDFEGSFNDGTFDETPYAGAKIVNFLDTYLGDEATLQTESLNIDITVTQVD